MSGSHTPPGTRVGIQQPAYDGDAGELLPIVLVNAVLSLVTLGLFRFWAKTRLRRYFLSRISFMGDRLAYTGTGKELFIGFLIVLMVLIPFSIAFQILSVWTQGQGWGWFGLVQCRLRRDFLLPVPFRHIPRQSVPAVAHQLARHPRRADRVRGPLRQPGHSWFR